MPETRLTWVSFASFPLLVRLLEVVLTVFDYRVGRIYKDSLDFVHRLKYDAFVFVVTYYLHLLL